jgi:signal transduction histidine kinase
LKKFAFVMSILISIFPLLMLSGLFYRELKSMTEEQVMSSIQRELDIGAQNMSDFLMERRGNLTEWAKSNPLRIAFEFRRPEGLASNLEFLLQQYPVYDWIAVVDWQGKVFSKTNSALDFDSATIQRLKLKDLREEKYLVHQGSLYVFELVPKSEIQFFDGVVLAKITDGKFNSFKDQVKEHIAKFDLVGVDFSYEKMNSGNSKGIPSEAQEQVGKLKLCSSANTILKLCALMENAELSKRLSKLQLALGFATFILILLTFFAINRAFQILVEPFSRILNSLMGVSQNEFKSIRVHSKLSELQVIEKRFNEAMFKIQEASVRLRDQARHQAFNEISIQVAHDIRSPLSALNMVSSTLIEVSEEKRLLIRQAIERVNDIANELLQKAKALSSHSEVKESPNSQKMLSTHPESGDSGSEICLIGAVLDSIVSEKRIQARDKLQINIRFDIHSSYGIFVNINVKEFKRVISNLINNAIENLELIKNPEQVGVIEVLVEQAPHFARVIVRDNGTGISNDVLAKLGERGITFGKHNSDSGHGLGIHHAKKTIESFRGRFQIQSEIGLGTRIVMELPRAESPVWFCDKLELKLEYTIVILDDDAAIHGLWRERFQNFSEELKGINLEVLNFVTAVQLIEWHNIKGSNVGDVLFLIDYELLKQTMSGLDVIEQLQIQKKSVLVTSHYLESDIVNRCIKLGLKQIPKSLAGFVPIEVAGINSDRN